jgi:uncharacterized membrane protein YkoI
VETLTGASFKRQVAVVLVAIGVLAVGVLAVAGTVGWGAMGSESSGADSSPAAGDESADRQNESDGNESVITADQTVEALQTVENRTNGTVFRARLSGEPAGELDQSKFVYELDVLAENGSHLVAEVYAANASIVGVEPANGSDGLFADLFGSNDEVPDKVRETDDLRSATDAVRLAINGTDGATENRTVTQVVLETQNESLIYRIQQFDPDGNPQEIIVAVTGEESVVTTDPADNRGLSVDARTNG